MIFFTKALLPATLFLVLTGGTIYSSAAPLFKTVVDTSFYEDLSHFNEGKSEGIFSSYIKNDPNNIREYFMNNSWNFLLKNSKNSSENVSGNGFVLNLLTPASFNSNSGKSYSPNFSISNEKIIFLVGTSLSFASKVFSKITDFSSDVNSTSSAAKFSEKADENVDLFFSHPYSNVKNENYMQENLYEVDSSYVNKANFLLNEPHYVKLEKNDVELVYAATDLEINKNLLDIKIYSNKSVSDSLNKIHDQNYSDISWTKEVPKFLKQDEKFKFAADFAVLKVSIAIKDIKGPFLRYLKKLYSFNGSVKLPKLIEGSIDVVNYKTGSVIMAGWSSFNERQKELEIMKNLWITAKAKEDKKENLKSKKPSEINYSNFNEYFDLNFSEKVNENSNGSSNQNYEYTNLKLHPNDNGSILFVDYWIKSKKTGAIFPEKKSAVLSGFQNSGESTLAQKNEDAENIKKYNLLVSGAKPLAEWKEIVFRHTYFDIRTVEQLIFDKKLSRIIGTKDQNLEESPEIFKFGDNEYLNLSHQLNIPNLDVSSAKGAVVLTNWNNYDNELLGMYTGKNSWNNPFSKIKTEGKIMLFVSPWRYDLINYENNLSKNTLAESLGKKNLEKKIVFPMIFKNKPSSQNSLVDEE